MLRTHLAFNLAMAPAGFDEQYMRQLNHFLWDMKWRSLLQEQHFWVPLLAGH
jgi:hypothetical protein